MNNDKSPLHLVTESDIAAFARGGGPPYDGGMEARVAKLEDFAFETRDRLARVETKLDGLAQLMGRTESDISDLRADGREMRGSVRALTYWMVGGFAAMLVVLAKGFGWL